MPILKDQDKTRLDKIVQQMVAANEPDENIQAVVDDFKGKYGTVPVEPSAGSKLLYGGIDLLSSIGSGVSKVANSIAQPATSLAAIPVQALAKGLGVKDPYAQGFPGVGGQSIPVSPLTLKQKSGDALRVAGQVGAVASAPVSIPGAIATGAAIGAAEGAGTALQQDKPLVEVAQQGGFGALVGGTVSGAVAGAGKLLGAIGDKIMTSVIRPSKFDIEDGFKLQTIKDYNLGGTLNQTLDKTKNKLGELTTQLNSKLAASKETVNIDKVVNDTIAELTDSSKLKGFGANQKIQTIIENLKGEVGFVGNKLSVSDAQVVKQAAGGFGAWQYGKTDPDAKAVEIVYNTFYSKLKTAIEKSSPDGVRSINQELAKLIPVLNATIRRLPVAERNNLISLSDMVGLVGSSVNPVALGPTILNLMSKSGFVGNALSKAGPAIQQGAVPVSALTTFSGLPEGLRQGINQ